MTNAESALWDLQDYPNAASLEGPENALRTVTLSVTVCYWGKDWGYYQTVGELWQEFQGSHNQ